MLLLCSVDPPGERKQHLNNETSDPCRSIQDQIVSRAESDPDFRKELLADPKTALAKAFGLKLNDGVRLTVHEETAEELHLVLPAPAPEFFGELADTDLEQVAGGSYGGGFSPEGGWGAYNFA
jgi:hypothetical protein